VAGNPPYAQEFRSARNLDTVPFRAPDPINRIIREVAASGGATLVPTEEIFRRSAPNGIPGQEAFIEHLHPTFLGTSRIAGAAADALLHRPTPAVTAADAGRLFTASGLTRFDLAYADARIAALSGRWPYVREGEEAPPFPYRLRSSAGGRRTLAAPETARRRDRPPQTPRKPPWCATS
jgi:hypothetical protein